MNALFDDVAAAFLVPCATNFEVAATPLLIDVEFIFAVSDQRGGVVSTFGDYPRFPQSRFLSGLPTSEIIRECR